MDEHVDEDFSVVLEINGELDLHQFSPKDVKTLVPDYLLECLKKDIHEVRIIHGKGKGVLRRTVHALLERLPYVAHFRLDDKQIGNWGATVVYLIDDAGVDQDR